MTDTKGWFGRAVAVAAVALGCAAMGGAPAMAGPSKKCADGWSSRSCAPFDDGGFGRAEAVGRSSARTGTAAGVQVFRTSFSLSDFETLTGARFTNTVGGKTYYSFFRDRPTLAANGFNFYINRNNDRIVFRSLGNARTPLDILSTFVDTRTKQQTQIAFNLGDPRSVLVRNFPRSPVAVSLN